MNNDLFIRVVLMLAIITFVKQLPKQIGDITGIKSEGMKMGLGGLKERFATGGGFAAGATLGGGVKSIAQSGVSARKNGKGVLGTTKAAALGGLSGSLRSGYQARGAKSYADMKAGANKGAQGVADSLDKKYSDAARYGMKNANVWQKDFYANIPKFVAGKTGDVENAVADWSGASSTEGLDKEIKLMQDAMKFKKDIEATDAVAKDTTVQVAQASYDAKLKDINKLLDAATTKYSGESSITVRKKDASGKYIKDASGNYVNTTVANNEANRNRLVSQEIDDSYARVKDAKKAAIKAASINKKDPIFNSLVEQRESFLKQNASNSTISRLDKDIIGKLSDNNDAIEAKLATLQSDRAKLIDKKKEAQGSK